MTPSDHGIVLLWEAIHQTPEEFGGALFDPDAGHAVLFYPGKAVRKGFLVWQKNSLESAAEVQAVDFRTNQDLWAATMGEGIDLSALRADEVHLALRSHGLRLAKDRVLAYHSVERHVGRVVCIDRPAGTIRWQLAAHEALPAHVSPNAGRVLVATASGEQVLHDGATGEKLATIGSGARDLLDAVLGDEGGVVVDDGRLRGFDRDGRETFSLDSIGSGGAMASERIAVSGHECIVAEPGAVKLLSLGDGSARWTAEGPRSSELVVQELGRYVAVQDAASGAARLLVRETGEAVAQALLDRLVSWTAMGDHLVGPTDDGTLLAIDPARGVPLWEARPSGVTLTGVTVVGDALMALGVEGDEDRPVLVRLSAGTGAERGRTASPLGGGAHLEAVGPRSVALSNPIAVFLYSLRD
jgi:outer membrane protein assembly factor BamB